MKKNKPAKSFDAVQMMRDIRDKLSAETQGMSFAELQAYMQQRLAQPVAASPST